MLQRLLSASQREVNRCKSFLYNKVSKNDRLPNSFLVRAKCFFFSFHLIFDSISFDEVLWVENERILSSQWIHIWSQYHCKRCRQVHLKTAYKFSLNYNSPKRQRNNPSWLSQSYHTIKRFINLCLRSLRYNTGHTIFAENQCAPPTDKSLCSVR